MTTTTTYEASYLELWRRGELAARAEAAAEMLASCRLCPHACGSDRRHEPTGACKTAGRATVCSYNPHFGEEAPLVGERGSGTIFFSHCNLKCQYCQNFEISHLGHGREVEPEDLAAIMLELQDDGCHNINLVSPSHVVPMVLAALDLAADKDLRLPLVYNTGGYDTIETLRLLDGVIDIYMPDMKYADADAGAVYSEAPDYPAVNQLAVSEMHRQVGDLLTDRRGIAHRGLLVRHLVLPDGLAGTDSIARFLAEQISPTTYLNVMDQYRPCFKAADTAPLDRSITKDEFAQALSAVEAAGLSRLDQGRSRANWFF